MRFGAASCRSACTASPSRSNASTKARQRPRPDLGQLHALGIPLEERGSDLALEVFDLRRHGAGRDPQFLSGEGEATEPGGRLEGPQGIERREAGKGRRNRHIMLIFSKPIIPEICVAGKPGSAEDCVNRIGDLR